jgi:hypothetical protein
MSHPTSPPHDRLAPLWAIQGIAFLGSIGTAVVQHGVYLLLERRFESPASALFGLSVLFGLTYIPGAFFIGPALSRLERRWTWLTPRAVLAAVLVLLGIATLFPLAAREGGIDALWVWWVMVAIYSPLTGVLWPMVESYLSGGRRGQRLRAITGQFNVVWAGAMVLTYFVMAPLVEDRQFLLLGIMGGIHIATAALVAALPRAPARHLADDAQPHPGSYTDLLHVFRWLLPTSYLVQSTLIVYLPLAVRSLGLSAADGVWLIGVWHIARVGTFFALERWHGWHGRWSTPITGAALLLAGFLLALSAPWLFSGSRGAWVMGLGLVPVGAGMGVIYAAAIYYALEVGHAQVEAGGTHESLIGLGMTLGPALGLLVALGVDLGIIPSGALAPVLATIVAVIAITISAVAVARARRHARVTPPAPRPQENPDLHLLNTPGP